ncbi:uncharacterized protein LOC144284312 [Canis aureus]
MVRPDFAFLNREMRLCSSLQAGPAQVVGGLAAARLPGSDLVKKTGDKRDCHHFAGSWKRPGGTFNTMPGNFLGQITQFIGSNNIFLAFLQVFADRLFKAGAQSQCTCFRFLLQQQPPEFQNLYQLKFDWRSKTTLSETRSLL